MLCSVVAYRVMLRFQVERLKNVAATKDATVEQLRAKVWELEAEIAGAQVDVCVWALRGRRFADAVLAHRARRHLCQVFA